MTPKFARALAITFALMTASLILAPFGLGWLPFVVGLGLIFYSLLRNGFFLQAGDDSVPGGEEEQVESPGARRRAARLRGQQRGMDEAERQRQARERARQEGDCALTHDERMRFQEIVQGMDRDSK